MNSACDSTRAAGGGLPEEFLQRARAFQESRALLTALELDLYTAVGEGARAGEVAGRLGTDPRATETLMHALAALGMLAKQGEVFRNGPLAERFFTAGSPEDARAVMMHTVHMWERWSTLTECVRAGTSVTYQEHEDREPRWTEAFIAAMHANASERAPAVVKAVGVEGVRRLLDVGGGSGAYAIAFAQAHPELEAEVLDLPRVVRIAEGHIARAGLSDRVKTRRGDLRQVAFGEGYDLVLLSAICHMLSPEENLDLLKRCRVALEAGGRVVIQDFILEPDKTAPRAGALFSLNMLVGTQRGASYSEPEYAAWLAEAGFAQVRHIRLAGPSGLMVGRRSGAGV
jgi:predicted O-methyltransferase YrrM